MNRLEWTAQPPEAVDKNPDAVFTVDEIARVLRCSPRTVRRRIKAREIRKLDGLGRLVRIHGSEIARLAGLGLLLACMMISSNFNEVPCMYEDIPEQMAVFNCDMPS